MTGILFPGCAWAACGTLPIRVIARMLWRRFIMEGTSSRGSGPGAPDRRRRRPRGYERAGTCISACTSSSTRIGLAM